MIMASLKKQQLFLHFAKVYKHNDNCRRQYHLISERLNLYDRDKIQ